MMKNSAYVLPDLLRRHGTSELCYRHIHWRSWTLSSISRTLSVDPRNCTFPVRQRPVRLLPHVYLYSPCSILNFGLSDPHPFVALPTPTQRNFSPAPAPPPKPRARTAADELEALLDDQDADGEPDEEVAVPSAPAVIPTLSSKQEEEEESEEDIPIAKIVPKLSKPPPAKSKPATKPPKPTPIPLAAKAKPPTNGKNKVTPENGSTSSKKRSYEAATVSSVEEPASRRVAPAAPSPPKRARVSPPPAPKEPVGLALPTSSGPDPLAHLASYGASSSNVIADAGAESGDDDQWEEVPATITTASTTGLALPKPPAPAPVSAEPYIPILTMEEVDGDTVDPDEGEEINMDEFAEDLERELQGDDAGGEDLYGDPFGDEDGEDMVEETILPVPTAPTGRPMSLNAYAGGAAQDDDDDDYSSSEDSDDDE